MKIRGVATVFILATLLIATPAAAATIRVSQESRPGGGDFDRNVLGFIRAYLRPRPAAEIYAYDDPAPYSYNGKVVAAEAETSQLFFVRTREGLTLFVLHDRVDNADGGYANMRFDISGDPNGAAYLARDSDLSDDYAQNKEGTRFTVLHEWNACCTDGLVLGTLEGRWSVLVQFINPGGDKGVPFGGLRRWKARSARGGTISLALKRGRRVRLDIVILVAKGSAADPR